MKLFYCKMKKNRRIQFFFFNIKIFSFKCRRIKPNIVIKKEDNNKLNRGVIYTCITGDYDFLNCHGCYNENWDYVCFTDNEKLVKKKKYKHWIIKPLVFKEESNSLINRWHKLFPNLLFPEYERSIYIDSNIDVLTNKLFKDVENLSKDVFLSVPKHFERNCIYDELRKVSKNGLDININLEKHLKMLKKENFPRHYGLGENNVIFRYHNNKICIKIMQDWWNLLKNFSKRDQLSLFFVLWKNNIKIQYLSDVNYRIDEKNFMFFPHKK